MCTTLIYETCWIFKTCSCPGAIYQFVKDFQLIILYFFSFFYCPRATLQIIRSMLYSPCIHTYSLNILIQLLPTLRIHYQLLQFYKIYQQYTYTSQEPKNILTHPIICDQTEYTK